LVEPDSSLDGESPDLFGIELFTSPFWCYWQAGLTGEAAYAMEGTSNSPACFRT
jgi:hypothetical protein